MAQVPSPGERAGGGEPARVADSGVRIRAEFSEMPGLQLTAAQAARLIAVDRVECDRLLADLVRQGDLSTDGQFFTLSETCRGASIGSRLRRP